VKPDKVKYGIDDSFSTTIVVNWERGVDSPGHLTSGGIANHESLRGCNHMKMREWFSLQYFRVQQIQALVSSLLAIMSFAVIIALYLRWEDTSRLLMMILVVIVAVYAFAWIWDMFLKVWIARQVINVRRNPFSIWRMTPREQMQYKETIIPIMKSQRETILILNQFAREMDLNPIATVDPDNLGLSESQIDKWERISGEGRFAKNDYPPEMRDVVWDEQVSLEKIKNGHTTKEPPR
jgi:hypothetical protein